MRTLIITIGGVLTGYIIGNLENKSFSEVLDDLSNKIKIWIDVITEFIGQTANDIEGFDSDMIKVNIDVFIDLLTMRVNEYLELKEFNEKISFIEETITEIAADLIKKSEKSRK